MKKYIARNADTQDKVFCKYEITKQGILVVEYYLPKAGFSVIWDNENNFCRMAGVRASADGRKTIVTYIIHPSYWLGCGFRGAYWGTIFDAMNYCVKDNIKIY